MENRDYIDMYNELLDSILLHQDMASFGISTQADRSKDIEKLNLLFEHKNSVMNKLDSLTDTSKGVKDFQANLKVISDKTNKAINSGKITLALQVKLYELYRSWADWAGLALREVENKQPTTVTEPPPSFTGSKLLDVYDPEKVHREFKQELNCDYITFKAWFIDSTICSKKMDWKYKNGNKTQLRSFIYVLCGGWEPAQTKTAFKIDVDSSTRQTAINEHLLQRIEKCTAK